MNSIVQPGERKIVVTRHEELRQYLLELGYINVTDEVVEHAHASDVRGRHVIGKLSLPLAATALSLTEIPLRLEHIDRGRTISLERLREIALAPQTFEVHRIA